MVFRTFSAASIGLDVYPVEVEVDGKQGVPQFVLIGLASRAVEEAKERITSALQNCNIRIRSKRTVVNLAPASVPKTGTAFDLAIAVGLLKMYGELQLNTDSFLFLGELALDGQIKPISGALALVLGAKKLGFTHFILPRKNLAEVSAIQHLTFLPVEHLLELIHKELVPAKGNAVIWAESSNQPKGIPTSIIGQHQAKRALLIAAAGRHNLLLSGPAGCGKTQLARTVPTLLPPLSESESIETTSIHSLLGFNPAGLLKQRPFRSPHHSTSRTALIGGGNPLRPGEISLAHNGVFFLDELLEFPSQTLDLLRQPLEDKKVTLTFATKRTTFPANCITVAATNPCPCGHAGSITKACSCSPNQVERYQQKLSGPLLDRFALRVFLDNERQLISDLAKPAQSINEQQQAISLITSAANFRQEREQKQGFLELSSIQDFLTHRQLHPTALRLFQRLASQSGLSGRGQLAVLLVARTVADLDGQLLIHANHVEEALALRTDFRKGGSTLI